MNELKKKERKKKKKERKKETNKKKKQRENFQHIIKISHSFGKKRIIFFLYRGNKLNCQLNFH